MPSNVVSFCTECGTKNLCLGAGLKTEQLVRLEGVCTEKKQVRAEQTLYQQASTFTALFAMASGTAKIVEQLADNRTVVTNIALRGDIIGFTGIANGIIQETVIPQEDSVFCVIPYDHLMQRMQHDPLVSRQIHKALARTLQQRQLALLHANESNANRKVSGFLCWFIHQLVLRNQYSTKFKLPLSRQDLANFLGLRQETVSRVFSNLSNLGIVKTRGRYIHVLNYPALRD